MNELAAPHGLPSVRGSYPSTLLWKCRVVQHSKIGQSMSAGGHNPNCRPPALCQLWPAADITPNSASSAPCQSTKSLRDSGGMWLVRSVFPTVEIVGSRCCLEDRGLSTLSEHAARRPMG